MSWWNTLLGMLLMIDRETLLEKRRDDYGTLRITENREGYRFLYFGEQTEQSCIFMADPAWLEYDYTRAMLLGAFWCRPEPDITLLGLGGGALANCLVRHFSPAGVRVVELRGEVLALAREWLALSTDPRLQVDIGGAEKHVAAAPGSCDLLGVDLYMEGGLSRLQMQREFFLDCQRALRPGGVLVINQWQMGETGLPYAAPLLRDLFGDQYLQVQVEEGNIILFVPALGDPPLAMDRAAMVEWAAGLEPALGYSLLPYINELRRAGDNPGPL